jgi:hypothetical protein
MRKKKHISKKEGFFERRGEREREREWSMIQEED